MIFTDKLDPNMIAFRCHEYRDEVISHFHASHDMCTISAHRVILIKYYREFMSDMTHCGQMTRYNLMITSSNWNIFQCYWPFVRGIHRSPVNFPHKGQWRGDLMFSLICSCTKGWVNSSDAVDLRRNCAHYDVTVMWIAITSLRGQ